MTYKLDTLWPETEIDPQEDAELENFLRGRRPRRRVARKATPRRATPKARPAAKRPPRVAARPPQRGPKRRPRPRGRRRRFLRTVRPAVTCPNHGEEIIRWVQSSLNQIAGTRLRVTGRMNRSSRNALRDFQGKEGLTTDGIAGPETQDALTKARQGGQGKTAQSEFDAEWFDEFEDATFDQEEENFLGDWWPFNKIKIVDRTHLTPKSKRVRTRDLSKVYALVLHQTAFSRGNRIDRYNKVGTHYVILPNGTIIQNHPDAAYLHASNGLNRGSVAVEFVGNFPNTKGRWWNGDKMGRNQVTDEQIASGRKLVRHLIKKIGLTHVLAHRQSSAMRANDPGPDIWKGVGQWAVDTLGMNDGGPTFKVGTGKPIPKEWREWTR